MVQGAVFDSVVQLGDLKIQNLSDKRCFILTRDETHAGRVKLLLLHVAEVLKELLPPLAEQPRLVAAAPTGKGAASAFTAVTASFERKEGNAHHLSCILSTSSVSQFLCMISRNDDSKSITSYGVHK